ncbi:hypothetical protein LWI29_005926 [Acer saccharum]|uniref:CCHC-type domain-containing protein n=1 Tax=Acer saccharum TaxID=4024 RepID=A0AA39TC77_ACESA|nr:hypothetical protein LWI29_005926 [Acer saccharum]
MVFQDDVMTEGASNSRPPLLKGHNYGFWKLRMKAYIRSIDERAWMTVEEGYLAPNKIEDGVTVSKPRSEWSTNEFELAKWHHRAMNAIFGGVDSRQFSYIQNLETAKEAWEALQVTNEGTKAVKKSRLQLLTSQFEVLQMGEEDKFIDFQDKLLDIANQCQALGTPISGERLNWKILRSLQKRFKAKVTAIEESKDVDVMSIDELLGSLQTFEACMKPKAKNKGLALNVVKEASSSDDDEEMALLVRKFRKFMRKGAKSSGKYSRDKEVKKSFTPPHERSGHAKSNRNVQCFKCNKLGHYASDCPSGDSKRDKKGKAMAATWSEDDTSSDEESSSDESSSEEELVSNFVAFMASHSTLEDVNQDSLDREIDQSHQECLNDNPSYIDLLAKVKFLEEKLKLALSEIDEKEDLIKIQVDEFVATTRRLLREKNAIEKKLCEVEAKNIRKVKNAYPTKFDHACVANNVEKKSINDIIVNQVVEELYSRFNIVVKENLDDVRVVHPRQNLSRVSALTISVSCTYNSRKGIDLDSCIGSYVYDVLKSRNWISWVNMLGVSNETIVREFYNAYKSGSTVTSATLSIRKVVFRVCPRKVNEFLNLSDDIESDFLDVDVLENLDLMGKTLCDDDDFVWGKRAFIRQGELTKLVHFGIYLYAPILLFLLMLRSNRDKIKIVYALVTNQPINLGELLVEQIQSAACTSRLDKKLAFPGFITQLCLASEKRMATMSYKDKGKSNDVLRLFGDSLDSNHVPNSPALPSWALKLRKEVEESHRLIEASQRKIEDLSAKLVAQDERIKELEGKSTPTRQYVRSAHRSSFLGGTSG